MRGVRTAGEIFSKKGGMLRDPGKLPTERARGACSSGLAETGGVAFLLSFGGGFLL